MAPRTQFTLAQFRTRSYNSLQNSPFWTSSEIDSYINEALRTWNCLTGYWKKTVSLPTSRNFSPYYNIGGLLTFGMRVEFMGVPLAPASLTSWDKGFPYWEGRPGVPEEWAPIGMSLIAIRPADRIGGNSLIIDGVANTPILVNDNDRIDLGQEEFSTMLGYVQYLAAFKEGGQEFQSSLSLYQSFLKAAASKNSKLNASALFRKTMGLDKDKVLRPWRAKTQQPIGAR